MRRVECALVLFETEGLQLYEPGNAEWRFTRIEASVELMAPVPANENSLPERTVRAPTQSPITTPAETASIKPTVDFDS